jgi:hypothetical protein
MAEWIYDGHRIGDEELQGFRAFVYVIRDVELDKLYYGKKRLQFIRRKKRRGRKNRVVVSRQSDWREYWGSNDQLKDRIRLVGESGFNRTILRLCRTLSEANYYELKYQLENDVLLYPDRFYNAYVGGRISRKQLGIKE